MFSFCKLYLILKYDRMNILEVNHLKKYFATQKAVDDISFKLVQGSIFGLLGPNGAGKTTLIRMITGIFYPDEGEIIFNGKKFDPVNDVMNIGYMPEERGLYKKMKIGEQAVYLARLKGLGHQEAIERVKKWFIKSAKEWVKNFNLLQPFCINPNSSSWMNLSADWIRLTVISSKTKSIIWLKAEVPLSSAPTGWSR